LRITIVTKEVGGLDSEQSNIVVFSSNQHIYVQNFSDKVGQVFLYNINGRLIANEMLSGNNIVALSINLRTAYIVKTVMPDETVLKKIVVN